jgi:hypothetical protein
MAPAVLALLVLITACAPAPVAPTEPVGTSGSPLTSAPGPSAALPTAASTVTPPTGATPGVPPIANPGVTVVASSFPVLTTLRTKLAVVDETVALAARGGVEIYLRNIDMYRRGESPVLPITGRFLAAVSTALKESATPGVKREFQLQSLVVDRHVQKPWGAHAYVDVTVTILDRDIAGSAPDQWETGKLRLVGERRFIVVDGWDEANGRWFNGFGPLPLDRVRSEIVDPIGFYLRWESWAPAAPIEQWRTSPDEATPFTIARAQRFAAIDRTKTIAQTFEGVTATIEQFETIEGIWSGLATVRVVATRVTTDATGVVRRDAFARRVRVFLFGAWAPEVVDEEITPGVWLSGGDLALDKIDVDRA